MGLSKPKNIAQAHKKAIKIPSPPAREVLSVWNLWGLFDVAESTKKCKRAETITMPRHTHRLSKNPINALVMRVISIAKGCSKQIIKSWHYSTKYAF